LVLLVGAGVMYALRLGPFAPAATRATPTPTLRPSPTASPSPSPSPTASPSPSPTPSPTASPTAEPTPTPTTPPTATPTPTGGDDFIAQLLSHVPESLREECSTFGANFGYLAAADCAADDGDIDVIYYLYASLDELDEAYQTAIDGLAGPRETGNCFDTATWPGENSYTIDGEPAGRVMCQATEDQARVLWTDTRLLIMTFAAELNADIERVWEFWLNEAGPF
jgi:hypothetical protein